MYDTQTRKRVLALVDCGRSLNSVSQETGVSRAAIRSWQVRVEPLRATATCFRCRETPGPPDDPAAYVYLLGLYLGDGYISAYRGSVPVLRIACADAWPGLMDACEEALRTLRPDNAVFRVPQQGCRQVSCYSKHWPCLIPQHGPGRKHDRKISLEPWQQELVDAHPWQLIRGLIHSDGCRLTNWTTRVVQGERKRYEYPRYFFTNVSDDIRQLYTDTLDALGVRWTHCTRNGHRYHISVARKASVALMDAHVGPKF